MGQMRDVGIVGIGHTSFGNLRKYEIIEVLGYAAQEAMIDAGVETDVDQVVVGNMGAGILGHASGICRLSSRR